MGEINRRFDPDYRNDPSAHWLSANDLSSREYEANIYHNSLSYNDLTGNFS